MDCSKKRASVVGDLPVDPLEEILSRVPTKPLCRFKCVSKAWRDLIADLLRCKKLPQTLEGFFFLSDSCGDDSGSADGGGDDLQPQPCAYFADVLGRSVRPVGSCFPFLAEVRVPSSENIRLLHHCNGLLLFGYIQEPDKSLNYIVSNPATQQWVAVPSSDGKPSSLGSGTLSSLVFDPAASSNFRLVQIKNYEDTVQVYSSKSGVWSPVGREWYSGCESNGNLYIAPGPCGTYVNGMLYVVLFAGIDQIAEMDVEGNIRKTIDVPLRKEAEEEDEFLPFTDYVGQSQGRLHCI